MGASGAGKTTLLKVLAGDAGGIIESSTVEDHMGLRINGQSMYDNRLKFNKQTEAMKWYKSVSKLVPQDDILLPSLTGRQTLRYHAELTMPKTSTPEEREAQVEKVLKMMNLMKCADTCVGSIEKRGMSGGERKRLSMGIELLSNPKVLLLDEPTTGLDSKNAEDVCRVMSLLAESGLAVVCSIHQPSYRVLKTFDRLVLLHDGRLVFNGRVDAMESYFESLGVVVPPHENPMDHFVKVVQESDAVRKEILRKRASRDEERKRVQENIKDFKNKNQGGVSNDVDRLAAPLLMNKSCDSGNATPMNLSGGMDVQKTEEASALKLADNGLIHLGIDNDEDDQKHVDEALSQVDEELPIDFAAEWKKVEALVLAARERAHFSTKETLSFASIVEQPLSSRHAASMRGSFRGKKAISYSTKFNPSATTHIPMANAVGGAQNNSMGTSFDANKNEMNNSGGNANNSNSNGNNTTSYMNTSAATSTQPQNMANNFWRRGSVGTISTAPDLTQSTDFRPFTKIGIQVVPSTAAQDKLKTLTDMQTLEQHPGYKTLDMAFNEVHMENNFVNHQIPEPQTFALARITGEVSNREEEEILASTVLGGYWQKLTPEMPSKEEIKRHHDSHSISIAQQTWLLFKRTMYDQLHDRKKFLGACIMKLSLGLLAGFCWLNQGRPADNQSIFPLTGVLYTMSNNCVMANLFQTILSLPTERSLAQREHRNGAYSLVAYYLSTIIASILIQTFQCVLLGVPPYFMVGLQPEFSKVLIFITTLSLLSSIGCALGLMVGAVASDYKSAQQAMLPILVPLTLFSGYVIPYDSIPQMFQPFYYASFFQYAFGILRLNQFKGLKLDDCDPYIPEPYNFCTGEEYLKSETANLDPAQHNISSKMLILVGELSLIAVVGFGLLKYKFSQKNC
eukprot:GDKK01046755.1.p1 GENE.GDKK01046755.1~~GDKK01046755.1.p1  ORF type:complete len:978 (-),score=280.35 GDKK01046755.1:296-3019(-)